MVKTPRTRHSKPKREPLTIELDPADVSREADVEAPSAPAEDTLAADRDTVAVTEAGEPHESPDVTEGRIPGSAEAGADADRTEADLLAADGGLPGRDAEPSERDARMDAAASEDAPASIETGTATQPEQEYRSAESVRDPSGYAFEEPKPASEEPFPATAAPPPKSGRDGFSRIAAGVIGAVIALAGAGALQYAGVLGAPGRAVPVEAPSDAEIQSLRQEIETLKAAAADPAALNEIRSRLDGLSGEVASVRENMSSAPGENPSGDPAAIQALDGRVKQVEDALAPLQGRDTPDQADLAALGDRIVSLQSELKAAVDANAGTDQRIAALEQSIGSLASRVDAQAQQPKIALAISTAALRSAIERGAPFSAELETFVAIAPGSPQIEALRPYAEKGVPTRDDLLQEIEPAAAAMIAAANPVNPNAGFLDRLMHSAESLVTVRPVGEVAGAGTAEVVARIEVALKGGDLDRAVAEFDSLPEAVQAAGGQFGERLKARRDVEKLVDQAIASAMKA